MPKEKEQNARYPLSFDRWGYRMPLPKKKKPKKKVNRIVDITTKFYLKSKSGVEFCDKYNDIAFEHGWTGNQIVNAFKLKKKNPKSQVTVWEVIVSLSEYLEHKYPKAKASQN